MGSHFSVATLERHLKVKFYKTKRASVRCSFEQEPRGVGGSWWAPSSEGAEHTVLWTLGCRGLLATIWLRQQVCVRCL